MNTVLILAAAFLGGGSAAQSTATSAGPKTAATGEPVPSVPRLFPFREDGKDGAWGYMDGKGQVVIKPKYRGADCFCEGRALVWFGRGDAYGGGYIDEQDRLVFRMPKDCTLGGRFRDGMASFRVHEKFGFHDRQGKVVVPPTYDDVWDYCEGLAPVNRGAQIQRGLGLDGGKWGYIDKTGREVIRLRFTRAGQFSEGLAPIGSYAYIDTTGKPAFTLDQLPLEDADWQGFYCQSFSDGLARFSTWLGKPRQTRTGFLDKTGKLAFSKLFADAGDFSERLAAVSDGKKWGYMDKTARVIISCRFDQASDFHEGLAAVRIDPAWGYVNRQGAWVVDPQRHEGLPGSINVAKDFLGGLAEVHIGGKLGLVDDGPSYWAGGAWYYINRQGQIVRRGHLDDDMN